MVYQCWQIQKLSFLLSILLHMEGDNIQNPRDIFEIDKLELIKEL